MELLVNSKTLSAVLLKFANAEVVQSDTSQKM